MQILILLDMILDKDVDTFLDEFQSLVEEYYTPAESES